MDPALLEAERLLKKWDSLSTKLLLGGLSVVATGIACSLAISIFTDNLNPIVIKILGFVAAISTAFVAAFHPTEVGRAFRQAWRGLNYAAVDFRANPDPSHRTAMIAAMKAGEAIIEAAEGRVVVGLP